MYQPPSTSKCRPFSVRKLFNLGSRLLTLNRKPKTNYYSKFTYLRTFYKKIIERIKISPNFAHRANLKFVYQFRTITEMTKSTVKTTAVYAKVRVVKIIHSILGQSLRHVLLRSSEKCFGLTCLQVYLAL